MAYSADTRLSDIPKGRLRNRQLLTQRGHETLGDLAKMTVREYLVIRNSGNTQYKQILDLFNEAGLAFKTAPSESAYQGNERSSWAETVTYEKDLNDIDLPDR